MRIVVFIMAIMCTAQAGITQFNFYAGYRGVLLINSDENNLNRAIADMNDHYRESDTAFAVKDFGYFNGFDLGLSYRFDDLRIELGWVNKSKRNSVDGILTTRDDDDEVMSTRDFNNAITTSMNGLSFGVYPTFGLFSIGGTIDHNWIKVSNDLEFPRNALEGKSRQWSSHFSVGFDFGNGGLIGVSIRPYAQIFWGDATDVRGNDGLDYSLPPGNPVDNFGQFTNFGIALLVYNGPQPIRRR